MWLYKCTSCPCIRAGFAFIAPEPISSATVIQKLQNSYTYSDTKIPSKHEKTATEALLLRFFRGVTGTILPLYETTRAKTFNR